MVSFPSAFLSTFATSDFFLSATPEWSKSVVAPRDTIESKLRNTVESRTTNEVDDLQNAKLESGLSEVVSENQTLYF